MRRMLAILFTLGQVLVGQAYAGPIENLNPGEWYEVPNSQMSAVDPCPARNCDYSGAEGQQAVIRDWSGGTYDTTRDRYVVWGGGHLGYGGNEIYAFDIATLTWTRLTNPSTGGSTLSGTQDPLADGRPDSRHTYSGSVYIPSIDRFWSSSGSLWQSSACSAKTWMYDFTAYPPESGWSMQVQGPEGGCGAFAAYDLVSDAVYIVTQSNYVPVLSRFDPHNLTAPWTSLNRNAVWSLYQTATIDTKRRKMVVVGGASYGTGHTWAYDIDKSGAPMTVLATTGDTSVETYNGAPGVVYDPVADRIIAWIGGNSVYSLNMDTLVWSQVTPAPSNSVTAPTVTAYGGTFNRFQYIPSKNAFIVVNSSLEDVFIYKLGTGILGAPPQAPSAPTVIIK